MFSYLPAPVDDGAADHLVGLRLPSLALPATAGPDVDLAQLPGRTVVYAYTRTGPPAQPELQDDWDLIPGARGCTEEACAFRDHHADIGRLGARVYGLAAQTTDEQLELVARAHLPLPLLSDSEGRLREALRLPTFEAGGHTLLKRHTLIVRDGVVEHVFYPVFPPDEHAAAVERWLASCT